MPEDGQRAKWPKCDDKNKFEDISLTVYNVNILKICYLILKLWQCILITTFYKMCKCLIILLFVSNFNVQVKINENDLREKQMCFSIKILVKLMTKWKKFGVTRFVL